MCHEIYPHSLTLQWSFFFTLFKQAKLKLEDKIISHVSTHLTHCIEWYNDIKLTSENMPSLHVNVMADIDLERY